MLGRVIRAGVAGGVALMLWTAVANVGFGFQLRTQLRPVPGERAVYEVLKQNVAAPGAYLANPAPDERGAFPAGAPVYGIRYAGFGHEVAGPAMLVEPVLALAAAFLVAWLLSLASARVLSHYWRRVAFLALTGLLLAVSGDLPDFGIGGYPAALALLIAANHLGSWLLAAVVMARLFGAPEPARGASHASGGRGAAA